MAVVVEAAVVTAVASVISDTEEVISSVSDVEAGVVLLLQEQRSIVQINKKQLFS